MSTLYTLKLKMWILPLKSRMKICTKREDGFIFEELFRWNIEVVSIKIKN